MSGACEQAVSTLNRTMHRDIFAGDNLLFASFVLLLVLNLAPLLGTSKNPILRAPAFGLPAFPVYLIILHY
jgi:hypothetical protein